MINNRFNVVYYLLYTLKFKLNNMKEKSELNKPDVSGSTVIEPINCELSESMKSHIEMLEWSNKFSDEARKQLMIPKEMFGSK